MVSGHQFLPRPSQETVPSLGTPAVSRVFDGATRWHLQWPLALVHYTHLPQLELEPLSLLPF